MHKALDKVDYETLVLNVKNNKVAEPPSPKSLAELAAEAINTHPGLAEQAILTVPAHLAPILLKTAILTTQPASASVILANWPLKELW